MSKQVLIAGAGIGGVSAALACSRAGWKISLVERNTAQAEAGAGIQLGPNVTRILHAWGLEAGLGAVAAFPPHLQVRDAVSGAQLGLLPLGADTLRKYGAPYATLHRADLHQLLRQAAQQKPEVQWAAPGMVTGFTQGGDAVTTLVDDGRHLQADLLLGADGLWSRVRESLLDDGPPRVTGHLAYRALVPQATLPAHLRSAHITVWLGPDLHVVQYPVRGGEYLNVVGIVHARHGSAQDAEVAASSSSSPAIAATEWDQRTTAARLRAALAGTDASLQDLVGAIDLWRRWVLCDRPVLQSADALAGGRVALLGDAAHPMRPYLAQGAGMAIEDAAALGQMLERPGQDAAAALRQYAELRWERNARVQRRALRNGQIFHARGLVRWGRDNALRLLGARLLDMPWLYGH